MMDFNATSSLSGQVTALIDLGLQQARDRQAQRTYLGASRLGVACERQLQFEYAGAPVDHGREHDRFLDPLVVPGGRHLARVVDDDRAAAIGEEQVELDVRSGGDQLEIELALEPLLHDVHVEEAEEPAAEPEPEGLRGLRLIVQGGVGELQPVERLPIPDERRALAIEGSGGALGDRREKQAHADTRGRLLGRQDAKRVGRNVRCHAREDDDGERC